MWYRTNMKKLLLLVCTFLLSANSATSQMRVIFPENIKVLSSPLPSFPAEVKDSIYGDEVRVLVDIDSKGKVKAAFGYGPLAPCTNLADATAVASKHAAVSAARSSIFESVMKDGKAVEERLSIGYRLRPSGKPLSEGEPRTISIGVANGRAISLPKPEYPEAAKPSRLSGGITVQVLIDERGQVISAAAISGHSHFSEPGAKAACLARFNPATLEKRPARMMGFIAYNFAP